MDEIWNLLASQHVGAIIAVERQIGLDGLYARYVAPHTREVGAVPAESWPPAAPILAP